MLSSLIVWLPQQKLIDSSVPWPQLILRTYEAARCSTLSQAGMILCEFCYLPRTHILPLLSTIVSPWQQGPV